MTTTDERDWFSPSTSCFTLAATQRAKLTCGKRVMVNRLSPTLAYRHGVIVAVGSGQVGEGDCAVLLADWDHPLAFWWNELELQEVAS